MLYVLEFMVVGPLGRKCRVYICNATARKVPNKKQQVNITANNVESIKGEIQEPQQCMATH